MPVLLASSAGDDGLRRSAVPSVLIVSRTSLDLQPCGHFFVLTVKRNDAHCQGSIFQREVAQGYDSVGLLPPKWYP